MTELKEWPGDRGFYTVRNSDIYTKLNEIEKFVTQLKTAVYLISFIVTPALSALISTIVISIGESQ